MKKILIILFLFAAYTLNAQTSKTVLDGSGIKGGLDTLHPLVATTPLSISAGSGLNADTIKCTTCATGATAFPANQVVRGTGTGSYSDSAFTVDTTKHFVGLNSTSPYSTLDIRAAYVGTVAQTNASATITGTNTFFKNDFKPFDSIYINGTGRVVSAVASNTSLTVTVNMGSTTSGLSYYGQYKYAPIYAFLNNGRILQGVDLSGSGVYDFAPLFVNSFAGRNIGLGYRSLANYNSSSSFNTAMGYSALAAVTSAQSNTAMGYNAMTAAQTNGSNTAFGYTAMAALTSGSNNVALGNSAMPSATTANDNIAIGQNTLALASPGSQNVAIGSIAIGNLTGNDNVALGYLAGRWDWTGNTVNGASSSSIYIGSGTKVSATSQNNAIAIGFGAITNGANTQVYGNLTHTQANIYGSIEQPVVAPSAPTLATSTSGGSITANTYYYKLTAVDASGNASFSGTQSASITTTGSTSTITVTFPTLPAGATGWNIYRTTTTLVYGASSLIAASQTGATYVDGAAATSSGTPSIVSAAFVHKFSAVSGGANWINNGGNFGIGTISPTARLHLAAGTATASTSPLKFTSGTSLTTAEAGAMEYDGTNLFFTPTGTIRKVVPTNVTGRSTAQTAAVATVVTQTVGAADASYYVSANVLVTTSSAENFTVTVAYTDEGNTARTLTLNFQTIAGVLGTAIAFANGAVPYEGIVTHIRCKAASTITIKTAAGGTYTGCTYNVEGNIVQTN